MPPPSVRATGRTDLGQFKTLPTQSAPDLKILLQLGAKKYSGDSTLDNFQNDHRESCMDQAVRRQLMPQLGLNPTSSEACRTEHLKLVVMQGDPTPAIVRPFHLSADGNIVRASSARSEKVPVDPGRFLEVDSDELLALQRWS